MWFTAVSCKVGSYVQRGLAVHDSRGRREIARLLPAQQDQGCIRCLRPAASAQEIMSDDDDCPRVSLGRASSRRGLGGDESCISDLGRRTAPSLGGMEKGRILAK